MSTFVSPCPETTVCSVFSDRALLFLACPQEQKPWSLWFVGPPQTPGQEVTRRMPTPGAERYSNLWPLGMPFPAVQEASAQTLYPLEFFPLLLQVLSQICRTLKG